MPMINEIFLFILGLFLGFLYVNYSVNIFMCFDGESFHQRNFMSKKNLGQTVSILCVSCDTDNQFVFKVFVCVCFFKLLSAL